MKYTNHVALNPRAYVKNRQWAVDYDYVDLLSDEEQAFLAQFSNEYYNGTVKKGDLNALHNTDELRKNCYNRNNISNRDALGIVSANNLVIRDSSYEGQQAMHSPYICPHNSVEDAMIGFIDAEGIF